MLGRILLPISQILALGAALSALAESPLVRVLDGDTYEIMLEGVPTRARLVNADTPETGERAKCPEEREAGERATAWVREQTATKQVAVFPTGKLDKYRRVLVRVTIDGQDLGELLVMQGLGRAYYGERRMTWCPER